MRRAFFKKITATLPQNTFNWLKRSFQLASKLVFKIELYNIRIHQNKALKSVSGKARIKVVFLLIHESIWKYEGVYKLIQQDDRFEPMVIICPYISHGKENMLRELEQAYSTFNEKGYKTIKSLNDDGTWMDIKKEIKPDIIFFTNPWLLTNKEYFITNFKNQLTCYVPYFFHVTKHLEENYGGIMQNMAWKVFVETDIHKKFAEKYSFNKASNAVVSGYPGLDMFLHQSVIHSDPWKLQSRNIKRIIWAPHHTVEGQDAGLLFSNFKKYSNLFLELARNHSSEIQIAFKPHPLLKPKLTVDPDWGEAKTIEYYNSWKTLENGQLVEGAYNDLFLTSDALIHDSGSFLVEYLATEKPSLYTMNDKNVSERLNEFGRYALEQHYQAYTENDISEFISKTVIGEEDIMLEERKAFIKEFLYLPNQKTASQNIVENLISSIHK